MAKTGAELIDTIRLRSGRQNDTVIITEDFVLDTLNEAQLHIVRKTPRLVGLDKSDTTTYRIDRWSTTAVDVTVAVRASTGVVTLTAADHGLAAGDIATVADVANDTDFDGNFEILSVTTDDITYFQNLAADDGVGATFGTIVQLAAKPTYDISTLNPAHIGGIWILNGAGTRQRGLKYRPLDDFRAKYIPVSKESISEPIEYTRQGNNIIFNCPIARDYQGLNLKIDYTAWATTLANDTTASVITGADKGLILFSLAEIYDELALGQPQFESKALKTRVLFNNWLEEFQDYNTMLFEELYN
jgi:hypothetical protein